MKEGEKYTSQDRQEDKTDYVPIIHYWNISIAWGLGICFFFFLFFIIFFPCRSNHHNLILIHTHWYTRILIHTDTY